MIKPLRQLFFLGTLLTFFATPAVAQEQDSNLVIAPSMLEGLTYRMVGPHRGGRVTAVAGVAGRKPTLYMGTTGGGVWKSSNHGLSYTNVSDGYFEVGSIGAISVAASDSNVVYVGTGSACIRSNVSTGKGVYKSLDGGETWLFLGLPDTGQIGSIAIHPKDPNLVYIAALGHPFGPNPERGVYRSFDGGENWEKVLYASDSTGAVSLAMNPQNPEEIYAALWRGERKPWTIISGGNRSGLYKTTDGGDSWSQLTEGLPTDLVGKIDVAVSPVNPERVYALVEAPDGAGGLYRSDDAGASFEHINDQKSLVYRPFYYTHVHADPVDVDRVYVSNEAFFVSTTGGTSFSRIATPHGDHHALWINPEDPDYLFQGNDGGATVSMDGGFSWSSIYNQPTAELYHVVVDNRIPYRLYGEQQDNTTISVPSLPPTASPALSGNQHWEAIAGCETGPIAVSRTDPDIIYGGCKGRFSRFNRRTGQEKQYWVYPHFNYGHATEDMPYRFQRTAPIEVSPHDPEVIYTGSQYVHKTTNEGVNWEIISPDLTAFESVTQGYSGEPITRDITGEEIYSAVYQIRASPVEAGVIWTGSNDGLIHITRDAGQTWTNVTPDSLLPGGRVQTIDPSPHRRGSAYVALYRYMLNDWHPYIFLTNDYGETWTLLTDGANGIPSDHPTRVVREDPNRAGLLYAGTEFGLFLSINNGKNWQRLQQNLPATPVTDLHVHNKDLVLSTMGRSFWILDDLSPLHQIDAMPDMASNHLFAPRSIHRLRWNAGRSQFDGAVPEYPPFGALIYYHLAEKVDDAVSLDILDAAGNTIRTYTNRQQDRQETDQPSMLHYHYQPQRTESSLPTDAGLHRFVWDLRHADAASLRTERGSVRGPLVAPGAYTVQLRIGDWQQRQEFELFLDPRLQDDDVSQADLEAQTLLSLRIRDAISEIRHTIARIRTLKNQLDERRESTAENESLAPRVSSLRERLADLEDQLIQTQDGKVGAQLKPKLMRQFSYLYGMLNMADQKPGEDAYQRTEDLEMELDTHLHTLETLLDEEIAGLNDALEEAGYAPVAMGSE